MNKREFQQALGLTGSQVDGFVGAKTRREFVRRVTNLRAPALTHHDLANAAQGLGVDVPRIKMLRAVESGPYGSFDALGRPTILFERHKFAAFTDDQFSARFPEISSRRAGGYSKRGLRHDDWQWEKLLAALALDPDAALRSCSWGLFQVMGFHWRALGYDSALHMVLTMRESEGQQLDALVRYLRTFGLQDELRACLPGDWRSCYALAKGYNGSGNALVYSRKLAAALQQQVQAL